MCRVQIRRKEAAKLIEEAKLRSISFKQDRVELAEVVELDDVRILILNGIPTLIILQDKKIIPHLQGLGRMTTCPIVLVDKGAVEPIVKGADVMMPGIVNHSEFKEEDPVAIVSEEYIPIAVGVAIQDSKNIVKGGKGKVIKNLHRPSDAFFEAIFSKSADSKEER